MKVALFTQSLGQVTTFVRRGKSDWLKDSINQPNHQNFVSVFLRMLTTLKVLLTPVHHYTHYR